MVSIGAETFQGLLLIKCNKNVLQPLKICSCACFISSISCSSCFPIKVTFFASCIVIFEVNYTFTLYYAFLE